MTRGLKLPDEKDMAGYARALRGEAPVGDRAERRGRAGLRKLGTAALLAASLGVAGASAYVLASASSSESLPSADAQICGVLTDAFPYEVPASVSADLLSDNLATQRAGWAALKQDMGVPSNGTFGEIIFTVSGQDSSLHEAIAQLNTIDAAERRDEGTLAEVDRPVVTPEQVPQVSVFSAEYCAPAGS